MKISSSQLLSELKNITSDNISFIETVLLKSDQDLNHRITNESWSVLECVEHLNRYGDFYIPEIENRISSSDKESTVNFTPGILGNYFAKNMYPKNKLNKMKTFKNINPIHRKLSKEVLKEFVKQKHLILILLERAKKVSLDKTKTSISISKLIKLRLGDTFRFVIYHNLRHIEQAKRILNSIDEI